VIRDPDGSACTWKPGSNYRLSLASLSPVLASAARHSLVGGVAVRDAWDGAVRDVSVEVGEGRRALTEAMRAHSASVSGGGCWGLGLGRRRVSTKQGRTRGHVDKGSAALLTCHASKRISATLSPRPCSWRWHWMSWRTRSCTQRGWGAPSWTRPPLSCCKPTGCWRPPHAKW